MKHPDNPFSGDLPRMVRLRDGQLATVIGFLLPSERAPYTLLGKLRDGTYACWMPDGSYEPRKIDTLDILGEVLPDGKLLALTKQKGTP